MHRLLDDPNDEIIICPNCNNEEITKGSNYLKVCGSFLINKCSEFDASKDEDLRNTIKWNSYDSGYGEMLDSRYCYK